MKIIQNNKEYGYQQPIINNIDVLLDVTNRTSGIASGTALDLSNSISNYERIIVTMWVSNVGSSASTTKYCISNEISVSDILSDYDSNKPIFMSWNTNSVAANNFVFLTFTTNTKVTLTMGSGAISIGRFKVEGVKRTAQVSNLDTWEDITSKCTFANGFTASNTKVYANPLFIYIGHYGNNGAHDNVLSITLPSGYEAFGCLAGNHLRATWSGAGAITSASNSSMTLGKGRYIWVGQPSGDSGNGILGGVLLRNV